MTDEEIKLDAVATHPDCRYVDIQPGLDCWFQVTRVAACYRNEECFFAGDPPRHYVNGYPGYGR